MSLKKERSAQLSSAAKSPIQPVQPAFGTTSQAKMTSYVSPAKRGKSCDKWPVRIPHTKTTMLETSRRSVEVNFDKWSRILSLFQFDHISVCLMLI